MLTLPHTKLTSLDVKYEIICYTCFKLCLVETKCCIKLYKCSPELKKQIIVYSVFETNFCSCFKNIIDFFYLFKENKALFPLYI